MQIFGDVNVDSDKPLASLSRSDLVLWHVADLGQCLTLVRDAPNNGHISEAAKPTRIAVPELKRR
jgi:hypothetical protein